MGWPDAVGKSRRCQGMLRTACPSTGGWAWRGSATQDLCSLARLRSSRRDSLTGFTGPGGSTLIFSLEQAILQILMLQLRQSSEIGNLEVRLNSFHGGRKAHIPRSPPLSPHHLTQHEDQVPSSSSCHNFATNWSCKATNSIRKTCFLA